MRYIAMGAAVALLASAPTASALASPEAAAPVAADAPGRWLRAESDHFLVYSDRSEIDLRQYAAMLEDFDSVLRLLLPGAGVDAPRKLPVYLVKSTFQLRRAYPAAGEQVAGFYAHHGEDIFAVAIRDELPAFQRGRGGRSEVVGGGGTAGDDVVMHEYVHHFMLQHFPNAYPGWLVEGIAEYYALTELTPRKVVVGLPNQARSYALLNNSWISMADLLGKRPSALRGERNEAFYAQSWLLTHYIWSDGARAAKLPDYLKRVQTGQDPMESWTEVYGDDAAGLEKALRAYLGSRLMGKAITRPPPPPPKITVGRMPGGADDLILEMQQLKNGVDEKERAVLLAKVRAAAAKRPNERYSRRALARTESQIGDRAVGERLLKTLIEEQPDDAEALQALAFSLMAGVDKDEKAADDARQSAYKAAGRLFVRANKADPNNFMTLYGYARSRAIEGEPSENTLDVVFSAADLAPQNAAIRMYAAQMFMRGGSYRSARLMLQPVAGDPHGGGAANVAAALLKDIAGKADRGAKAD